MIYGVSVWGGGNLSNICKIDRNIRASINTFICNLQPNITPPLKFEYVYKLKCLPQFHKHKFDRYLIRIFFVKILELIPSHDHNTRFFVNNNCSFPVISKTIYQKPFVLAIKLWNNLPPELKLEQSTTTFKRKLKTLLYNTL